MTEYEKKSLAEQKRCNDVHINASNIVTDETRKQTHLLTEIRDLLIANQGPETLEQWLLRRSIAKPRLAAQQGAVTREALDREAQQLPEDQQGLAEPGVNHAATGFSMGDWVILAKAVESCVNREMAARIENAREGRDKAQAELAKRTHELDKAIQGWADTTMEREELKLKLSKAEAKLNLSRSTNALLIKKLEAATKPKAKKAK